MAFLEVQLEKVSHALISSKSFDERIESTTNKLGYYDEKFNTMMKLVKLIQAANESQVNLYMIFLIFKNFSHFSGA